MLFRQDGDCVGPDLVCHVTIGGDTIRAETTVVALRDSKSRPTQGIVTFEHRGFNQKNEIVATFTAMVAERGYDAVSLRDVAEALGMSKGTIDSSA